MGELMDASEKVEVDENLFDGDNLDDLDGLEDELADLDTADMQQKVWKGFGYDYAENCGSEIVNSSINDLYKSKKC